MLSGKKKVLAFAAVIFAGESIFFLPFVLARIFRPTLLQVFDITNLELGAYFSIYGIVAMISYLFGGLIADRFPGKQLMAFALWATALGGGIMALFPVATVLGPLYAFWGITTIFLFWAALIKTTRALGGSDFQGSAFGILEGGRGATAALLASVAMLLFASFTGDESGSQFAAERLFSFRWVVAVTAVLTGLAGFFIWVAVPASLGASEASQNIQLRQLKQLVTSKGVGLQALMIVCAYVGYKITDDFSLYAYDVLGFSEVDSAAVGTTALWLRPLFALFAGLLADRWKGSSVVIGCFTVMGMGGAVIAMGWAEGLGWLVLTVLATTLLGVYGVRGVYFALMEEDRIPIGVTGTAVGVISLLGFTPDVFMSPLMGYLLDTYPGVTGHRYVFLVLAAFSLVGLFAGSLFYRRTAK